MSADDRISVGEMQPQEVEQVLVARGDGRLLLMLNNQPYAIDLDRATSLAWSLCQHVDAARCDGIEKLAAQQAPNSAKQ